MGKQLKTVEQKRREDPLPYKVVELKNQSFGEGGTVRSWEYIRVRMKNGQYSHGGNQLWWSDKGKDPRDATFRLCHMGCGVIAMNDLEWYLSGGETIPWEKYEEVLLKNWQERYYIKGDPLNRSVGLYPWKMERGLKAFLREKGSLFQKVKWAPMTKKGCAKKDAVLEEIREMLKKDLPVVCAYHTFDKKGGRLVLYHRLEDAANGLEPSKHDPTIDSHYMTIIGLYRDEKGEDYLKLVSWGRVYYARYDRFASKINLFTNILKIS